MLSWHWLTGAVGEIQTRDLAIASPSLYHMATSAVWGTNGVDHTITLHLARPTVSTVERNHVGCCAEAWHRRRHRLACQKLDQSCTPSGVRCFVSRR